jgi:hypothetical protein
MARPEPIKPNGSKIGKLVGRFCETPKPCNFADG